MRLPDRDAVGELLDWSPEHGIVSVYLRFEPEDRGEGWRIELRNGLSEVIDRIRSAGPRETRLALEATAKRILDRLPAEQPHPDGRAQIGFVEVRSDSGAPERWFAAQVPPARTEVLHNHRPYLLPLVALLDDGAARGVLLVSSERARVLEWNLGVIEELESPELEIFSLDWRERKAQRSADPGAGQGASASGHDQHDQRLDANRERFLHELGRLAQARARDRGWREVLAFGRPEQVREVIAGADRGLPIRAADEHDLISASTGELAERLGDVLERLNREREAELVERVRDQALGGTHGSLGLPETIQALTEGRVEHLLFDSERDYSDAGVELPDPDGHEAPIAERMIEMAFATSAEVTPLEGEVAQSLADAGGVAALLRY